jgi:hypothetical protein
MAPLNVLAAPGDPPRRVSPQVRRAQDIAELTASRLWKIPHIGYLLSHYPLGELNEETISFQLRRPDDRPVGFPWRVLFSNRRWDGKYPDSLILDNNYDGVPIPIPDEVSIRVNEQPLVIPPDAYIRLPKDDYYLIDIEYRGVVQSALFQSNFAPEQVQNAFWRRLTTLIKERQNARRSELLGELLSRSTFGRSVTRDAGALRRAYLARVRALRGRTTNQVLQEDLGIDRDFTTARGLIRQIRDLSDDLDVRFPIDYLARIGGRASICGDILGRLSEDGPSPDDSEIREPWGMGMHPLVRQELRRRGELP